MCYHPLFVFNQFGDCEGAMLRAGNVPGKPMCGALPRNREQTFRDPPGTIPASGRSIIVLKQT